MPPNLFPQKEQINSSLNPSKSLKLTKQKLKLPKNLIETFTIMNEKINKKLTQTSIIQITFANSNINTSVFQQQANLLGQTDKQKFVISLEIQNQFIENQNKFSSAVSSSKQLFHKYKYLWKNSQYKIGQNLISNQDRLLKKLLIRGQLNFDYISTLPVLTLQNLKSFQSHERQAPYRNNLLKSIQELRALFKNKHLSACFSYNKFTCQQIMAILQRTKNEQDEIKLTSLYLAWTRINRIIEFLQFKKFEKLKVINIGGNFVQSIQLLCQIELPVLQDIYIWNNNLTQIRALKRCSWPNLKVLDAHVNKIVDLKDLRFLGNKKIGTIIFDSNMLVCFNQAIVLCSSSSKAKISIMSNKVLSFMGRPTLRRRKKAIQVQPCSMHIRYI